LQDGLKRAAAYPKTCQIAARLHLIHTDAVSYMQSLSEKEKPDVIYLDPMFPDRKKSAKVKKEMQVLQALLGHETPLETEKLFEAALNCAQQSVVVKRPKLAPCISQKLKPHHILQGKTCRFEVFSRLPENFSLPEKGSY